MGDLLQRPRGWPRGRGAESGDGGSGEGSGNDIERRVRDVERQVDRIPGEIRVQTTEISGKLETLNNKLDLKFETVATREWILGKALWVYSLVVAILVALAAMILNVTLSGHITEQPPAAVTAPGTPPSDSP